MRVRVRVKVRVRVRVRVTCAKVCIRLRESSPLMTTGAPPSKVLNMASAGAAALMRPVALLIAHGCSTAAATWLGLGLGLG